MLCAQHPVPPVHPFWRDFSRRTQRRLLVSHNMTHIGTNGRPVDFDFRFIVTDCICKTHCGARAVPKSEGVFVQHPPTVAPRHLDPRYFPCYFCSIYTEVDCRERERERGRPHSPYQVDIVAPKARGTKEHAKILTGLLSSV